MKINEITLTEEKFLNEQEILLEFLPALVAGGAILWGLLQTYLIGMSLTEIYQILSNHGVDFDDSTPDTMTDEDWDAVVIDVIMLAVPGAAKLGSKAILKFLPTKFISIASSKIKGFFSKSVSEGAQAVKQMPKNLKAIDPGKGEKLLGSKWDEKEKVWKVTYRDARGRIQSRKVEPSKFSKAVDAAKPGIKQVSQGVAVGAAASMGGIQATKTGGAGRNIVNKITGGNYPVGGSGQGGTGGAAQSKLSPQQQKLSQEFSSYPLTITFDPKNPKIMIVNGSPVTDAEGYQHVGDSVINNIKHLASLVKKGDPTVGIPKRPGFNYN